MQKQNNGAASLRKLFKTTVWIVAVGVFFAILGASATSSDSKPFSNFYIKIDHDKRLFFIDDNEVKRSIEEFAGTGWEDLQTGQINFADVEEMLEMNPYIERAEVYLSSKGAVQIDIRQREPLFRIVNSSGVSYYFDVNGVKIPASSKFTARVVVVTGNVESTGDSSVFGQLMKLCRFISNDGFWKAQFEQIHVTREGEFQLVPKLGNHIILLGNADDLEESFGKLMVFYKEVLKNFDAEDFRIVNLKYKDQIVCTKNTL
jgi:cell division protein FtsQ